MKHVELEQFWHAFTSRGFDSVSWAFLFQQLKQGYYRRAESTVKHYNLAAS